MTDKRVMLKVKLKSLMSESKIIRKEEVRNRELREELYRHRKDVVREEARLTHLAYGFIRGRQFCQVESHKFGTLPTFTKPQYERIAAMVKKYGPREVLFSLESWLNGELDD